MQFGDGYYGWPVLITMLLVIQSGRKVKQPISDTFYLSKNKLHWNKNTKKSYIRVRNVHRVQRCMHSLFSFVWCKLLKSSCVMETVHQTRYCRFVWHRRIGKCIPKTHSGKLSKNEMPRSVRQWTLVALLKKTSLHFDCWKTTDGLARAGYNMTWSSWALV
jgi:hypothetical protein